MSVVPLAIALSVILLVAFYFWEQSMVKRERTPLVAMKLFANRQFTNGAVLTGLLSVGQIGLIFGLPVFLQGVRGLDALHTGYALLPMSFALLLIAPLGGVLTHWFKPKHIVQVGLLVNVVGIIVLRQAITTGASAADFILPLSIYGIGMGLCFSQLSNITLSAVSVDEAGEASGVNSTIRQVGSSLGTAIIGSILIASLAGNLKTGIANSTIIPAKSRTAVAEQISAQSSAVEFGTPFTSSTKLSHEQDVEIKNISNSSTVRANREALLYTALFTASALLLAGRLPNTKQLEKNESLAPSGH
jgi:predicted MFS family arabinose efflux permease